MARDKLEYPNKINWKFISEGIEYYQDMGFKYIEVPWLAPEEIMRMTFNGPYRFKTEGLGDLVASGEQSFLYLEQNGELEPGKYMTVTPCFRDEKETNLNFKQFVKLELYETEDVSEKRLDHIVGMAYPFFSHRIFDALGPWKPFSLVMRTMEDDSIDIELNDIELGSYGIREHDGHRWIYATGVAEPRLSQAIRLCQEEPL